MVNVYMDRKVKFRMKLFKKLKEKMNRYLERVAKENNELFDGGVPDCCKLNQKQNLKKKYPEEIHDFCKKFYQISHKKQEGVRISIVTTKM